MTVVLSEAFSPSLVIVPGLGGSGPEHWQTVWAALLPRASRVTQRDWDHPDRELWLQGLRQAIDGRPDLVILDLGLPQRDGLDVTRARWRGRPPRRRRR